MFAVVLVFTEVADVVADVVPEVVAGVVALFVVDVPPVVVGGWIAVVVGKGAQSSTWNVVWRNPRLTGRPVLAAFFVCLLVGKKNKPKKIGKKFTCIAQNPRLLIGRQISEDRGWHPHDQNFQFERLSLIDLQCPRDKASKSLRRLLGKTKFLWENLPGKKKNTENSFF